MEFKILLSLMTATLATVSGTAETVTYPIHVGLASANNSESLVTLNWSVLMPHIVREGKNFVRWLCLEINRTVIRTIPLVADYNCPICTTIVWKPGLFAFPLILTSSQIGLWTHILYFVYGSTSENESQRLPCV